jgi:hypothetical protein
MARKDIDETPASVLAAGLINEFIAKKGRDSMRCAVIRIFVHDWIPDKITVEHPVVKYNRREGIMVDVND